ncbi:hypothetical protein [Achromobacter marplatensis]|uniref:hypothetical protein n=1 Tax=Achromobacter marplatensis TaxID=470868 RepID=UPI0028E6261F|nr:hypothetical protein [Achromobacter marplatensis]
MQKPESVQRSPRELSALNVRRARDLFLMERPSSVGPILLAHLFIESLMAHALLRKVHQRKLYRKGFSDKLDMLVKQFCFRRNAYPWSALRTLNDCRNQIAHTYGVEAPRQLSRLLEVVGSRGKGDAGDMEKRIRAFVVSNKDTPFAELDVEVMEGKVERGTAFHHAIVQLYVDVASALGESLPAISGTRLDPHACAA